MFVHIHMSVHMSMHMSMHMSIHMCMHMSMHTSMHMSIHIACTQVTLEFRAGSVIVDVTLPGAAAAKLLAQVCILGHWHPVNPILGSVVASWSAS